MKDFSLTPEALQELMEIAEEACLDARLLLERGSPNGAMNRAYYAMFDAALAVLLASGAPPDIGKSHTGMTKYFTKFIYDTRPEHKDLGSQLRKAFNARCLADYGRAKVSVDAARSLVEEADKFVDILRIEFFPGNDEGDDDFGPK